MWSYEYEDNTAKSYDQETNILYEISKSGNGLFYGDVRLKLDYKFKVKKFLSGKTLDDSLDLVVRPNKIEFMDFVMEC